MMSDWRLIAPPENWQMPLAMEDAMLPLLTQLAERLTLQMTVDEAQKKLYLGLPRGKAEVKGGVRFPGGSYAKPPAMQNESSKYRATGSYTAAPLLAVSREDRLSEHFLAGEFFPKDDSYRYLRVAPALVEKLEAIRHKLGGQAITIHSGYRPASYNALIGGVSNSAHIDGLAADISADGVSTQRLHEVADQVVGDGGGVGYYPQQEFVHIDVRGQRSRWTG